jgi:hypothetical protein
MHEIRGEYWIQNGHVEFADGDTGDSNHEMIANNHVIYQFADNIIALAKETGIPTENAYRYGEYDSEVIVDILDNLEKYLKKDNVMQHLGCNQEAYAILQGGGDSRLYVMKYEGWIAIRSNNIELFGYDEQKRKELVSGLSEILEDEGIDESVPPEEIEFWFDDHKTNRSHSISLAELEQPITMRSNIMVQSVKKIQPNKDSEENKYQNPSSSVKNKWTQAAQDKGVIPPGHDLWRGTSEGWMPFKKWLNFRENKL